MLRGLCLVLLASACFAGGAQAQAVEVPRAYAIPLPPNANPEPQWELGMRYWYSEGSTRFDINSSQRAPILGNPTSTLNYDGIDANSLEFVWAVRNEARTFFKGFVGGGWLSGGSLDDEDYLAGQIKFSDTYSRLDGESMGYGTIDVGQDFTLIDNKARVVVSPFIGFNYWQETVDGYGARCNADDVGGFFCGPPGSIEVPFSTEVITNKASWSSLRLGAELKAKLWDRLTLRGDAAIVPLAYLWNQDSHYLRRDLGPVPNITDSGTGWGYPARRRGTPRRHRSLGLRRRRPLLVCPDQRRQRLHQSRRDDGASGFHERALRRVQQRHLPLLHLLGPFALQLRT